jgi:hypothetical protein
MAFSIRRPVSAIVLTVLLVSTASSCHKKVVAVPVPSEPTTVQAAEPAPQQPTTPPPSNVTPPAPAPTTAPPQAAPPKDESKYQKNKPPDQPPPPKHATHPANPAPAPAPQTPTPPAEPPRLGDILTPEQQHEHNTAIDLSLAHAQASLGFITTRQLTKEQEATVAEIQNFIQQAQEKRKDDLAAAKSLAERAEVLSHDLVASLRK